MTTTFDGPALTLTDVVKSFGGTRAVDGLTMDVQPGTVLAFLGPNGAGKTTTIEMCEGFLAPTSGEISVLGLNPATHPERVRERIGIMLQEGGAYNGARVAEMMHLSASYHHNPHDPDWLIGLLGLDGVRSTAYRRLSGGQKQRLSIAMALISRPQMVFLDEPTAGMDAQSRLAVWDLIRALKRDGVTVVLTTHMMDEAEALADDVVIIDRGRVVAQGSPAELTAGDATRAEELLLTTDRDLDVSGMNVHGLTMTRPLHYRVAAPATPELLAAVAAGAAAQGVLLRSVAVTHRNLEDVFLDITGRDLRS
ncbi:ABC transporter ATP-binding protein [Corynebacterium guangdongense]|uniref:ABC-2 type transport system ATP-binding protein n=1 Tax=Corynebacterium guangdongense TaxID=1783348 RepID=A0ABU1ZWS7_9CORY|nr:ABC transporter ATP-binding protein [Corynebacterium guangdongense]MDR7329384.1 ABC-2 type transport system ATP-binding protein [Corynebacterium guangdongense]WJZ17949.1 Daunorubicin/doxorubicin resistance ATP-binding protein DrrA [Corynebacterium guangdongense]